uniref:Methyltransferase domain-containing protein n=1 Tax=Candidatus Kentrum sp. MB TaxID=2138164 RepID=A0A450XWP4_9GAMM|nr:MAG: Methyltransferase domain-containing protein [Candidatus Kentron sp. MB]VFK33721.1 MAG: Methyltransferase domain-containing protein [Candidatus Kentron sp. MB]VFK76319.1 MAG: Methyltransferase domain-containing protein [Candidatus Kentron sp. MB]
MKCRHCRTPLNLTFLDLGSAPPSNAYLSIDDLARPEVSYPLKLLVCDTCGLVQTQDYTNADELFTPDYAYFSSTSTSWLAHAADYCQLIRKRLSLNADSLVIEVACNDGYLLKNFVAAGIPCLGIEPTDGTAQAAEALGIPVLRRFFGQDLGVELLERHQQADLIIGNNVYAHVPDINDFTMGLRAALKPDGVVTLEFPHLMRLVEFRQFDTVYHEHFSYLSLHTASRIFAAAGLRVFDVEELPTHGGSLRIYGCREEAEYMETEAVSALMAEEDSRGVNTTDWYQAFQEKANAVKNGLLSFLLEQKRLGKTVAGYGAAAKGNTLLNYAGVKSDLLPFICDAAPSKIGKFMPGSRIPILSPDVLRTQRPDYLLILPWNIAPEIKQQNAHLAEAGARFVTAVPELEIS